MVNLNQIPKLINITGKQLIHYAEMLKKTTPTQKHLINPQTIQIFGKLGEWLVRQSIFVGKPLGIKIQENLIEFEMPDAAKAASPQELNQRIQDLKSFGNIIINATKQTKDEKLIVELTAIQKKLDDAIPLLQKTLQESKMYKLKEYWENNNSNPIVVCENISKKFKLSLNETLEIIENISGKEN